ncbi:Metallothionein expression activator [Lobulomyces angularis]|nr:Metallothionein expression activator [Lobulomyces angularis]
MDEPILFDVFSLEMPSGVISPESGHYTIPESTSLPHFTSPGENATPDSDKSPSKFELHPLRNSQFAYPIIQKRNNVYGYDIELSNPDYLNANNPYLQNPDILGSFSNQPVTQQQLYYSIPSYNFFPLSPNQNLDQQFLPPLPNNNAQDIKYNLYPTVFQHQSQLQQSYEIGGRKYKAKIKGVTSNADEALEIFKCTHEGCPKVFNHIFNLKSHLKAHSPERSFVCDQCSSSFRRSHDLKRHCRSIHSSIKPFECRSCSKSFSRMVSRNFKFESHLTLKEYLFFFKLSKEIDIFANIFQI